MHLEFILLLSILDLQIKMTKECCPEKCFSQFSVDEVYQFILNLRELEKPMRDMMVMGKLAVCVEKPEEVKGRKRIKLDERQRIKYNYRLVDCRLEVLNAL